MFNLSSSDVRMNDSAFSYNLFVGTNGITLGDLSGNTASIATIKMRGGLSYQGNGTPYTAASLTAGMDTNHLFYLNNTSNNITFNLPAVSSTNGKLQWAIKTDTSANTTTVDPNSSETINGQTTAVLYSQYDSMLVHNNNSLHTVLVDNRAPQIFTITGNTTVPASHRDITYMCDATAGNVTVTGYALAGKRGWKVTLKKIDASGNQCAWASASGAGDGASWNTTTQYAGKTMQFDGTDTWIVGSF
jgi:hypothetical protein